MACQNCNTDCSTVNQLLVLNGCKKTNSSKPTGAFISSYPLPALSSYASFDPSAPVDQTQFVTDLTARLSNTDAVLDDAIRCLCLQMTIPALELPEVEDCDGTSLYGSARLELEATIYDFSTEMLAFLRDISNCNRTVYFYVKTEDLLIGAYEGEASNCFVPFKGTIRANTTFDGGRGELNAITLNITTSYIKDVVFWEQEFISGLDLNASCTAYN